MKNTKLISLLMVILSSAAMNAQQKNMTFNIRFDNPGDGEDRWELRKVELCDFINRQQPDFLGLQEALPNQVEFLHSELQEYSYFGFGRDGKGSQSESVPIFYKSGNYDLLEAEVFWLSETPGVPSRGWDAALNRITTYGVFQNKQTLDTIHVFNTHYDHRGEKARLNSSHLLVSKLNTLKLLDKKVILMGDFNSRPEEEPIRILNGTLEDAFTNSKPYARGPEGTFNAFDSDTLPGPRIDYIFTLNLKVLSFETIDEKRKNGRWISDHLPVVIEVAE